MSYFRLEQSEWLSSRRGRWRRGELREITQAKALFNLCHLFQCVLKTILAKLLVLDFLKLVVHFIELFCVLCFFPRGEDDRVLDSCVMLIHADQRLQRCGKSLHVGACDFRSGCRRQDKVSYLAAALVLGNQDIRVGSGGSAGFFHRRKNVGFFEFLFVILLAKSAKQLGIFLQWFRWNRRSIA